VRNLDISRTPKKHISLVHQKLGEADFFLGKMTKQESPRGDSERFGYYLSAFFSAAMSARDHAIKGWGAQWKANLCEQERRLYEFMGKGRVAEVHNSGTARAVEQEEIDRTRDMIGTGGQFSFSKDEYVREYTSTYWFRIDGKDCKVTQVCGDYLALLRRMVADFQAPKG
jgi:hypothetical protein